MAKRFHVYAWLTAITMWSILAIDYSGPGVRDRLGKVKGTDFLQFYVAGSFVREGQPDALYNFVTYHRRMQAVAGGSDDIVYLPVQSPQTALAFSGLAATPYTTALALWIGVTLALYAFACWALWRRSDALHRYPRETLAACAAFPALYATVLHGQLSCVALVMVVAGLEALRHRQGLLAGMAFGCLAFKPHWVAVAAAMFLVAREWRVVLGIAVAAITQVGVTILILGSVVVTDYFVSVGRFSVQFGDLLEPRASNTLKGLISALVPFPAAALAFYAIAAIVTIIAAARLWRAELPFEIRASSVLAAMILISPHAFEYDLLLLLPLFFMMAHWFLATRSPLRAIPALLAAAYVAPVLTALPDLVRLQFSVTSLAALLAVLLVSLRQQEGQAFAGRAVLARLDGQSV